VVSAIRYRRADRDFVLDVISRKDIEPTGGVRVSRPYHRSGVVLAVRSDSLAPSLASLGSDQRVRVQLGSQLSVKLSKGGTTTSPFAYEDDIVGALRGSRRHADDRRLVQPAACRPAVAPDSGWQPRNMGNAVPDI
jgi:polar amino acid transport system substrate-binding protein